MSCFDIEGSFLRSRILFIDFSFWKNCYDEAWEKK